MREILFRGKRLDNDKWVEGYYVHLHDPFRRKESHRIYIGYAESECDSNQDLFYPDYFDVVPASVGQFTGQRDKNCKKIFEGDIIRAVGNNNPALTYIGAVVYRETSFFIEEHNELYSKLHSFKKVVMYNDMQASAEIEYTLEVIGNIHDNPELWKEGEV